MNRFQKGYKETEGKPLKQQPFSWEQPVPLAFLYAKKASVQNLVISVR
ncbi:hypothetical protein [Brevibacillus sp. SKDU10]|nr:hypothetical protein [Brevibacillus sp. SKDU10]